MGNGFAQTGVGGAGGTAEFPQESISPSSILTVMDGPVCFSLGGSGSLKGGEVCLAHESISHNAI